MVKKKKGKKFKFDDDTEEEDEFTEEDEDEMSKKKGPSKRKVLGKKKALLSSEEEEDEIIEKKYERKAKKGKKKKGKKLTSEDASEEGAIEDYEGKAKKKGKSKKGKKLGSDVVENVDVDNDKHIQDTIGGKVADVTIDIDQIKHPKLMKRVSSLKEIIVENPPVSSPPTTEEVAIEIPDSPRVEDVESSSLEIDNVHVPEKDNVVKEEDSMMNDLLRRNNVDGMNDQPISSQPVPSITNIIAVEEIDSSMGKQSFDNNVTDISKTKEIIDDHVDKKAENEISFDDYISMQINTSEIPDSYEKPDFSIKENNIVVNTATVDNIANTPSSVDTDVNIAQARKESKHIIDIFQNTSPPDESFRDSPILVQRMNTANIPITEERAIPTRRPGSAQTVSSHARLAQTGSTQNDLVVIDEPITLGHTESVHKVDISDEEHPGRENITDEIIADELNLAGENDLLPVNFPINDTNTPSHQSKELIAPLTLSNEQEIKSTTFDGGLEEPSKDMPPRRNFEPNKNKHMELEDQEMDLTENNDTLPTPVPETENVDDRKSSLPPLGNDDELPWAMYRGMRDTIEGENEKSDIPHEMEDVSQSDDDDYAPSLNKDLPDLYEAMDSLDTDDIELNLKTSPPSVLDSAQQNIYNKNVHNLKQGLAEEEIKVYLDEFENHVKKEILMIGNISLEEIQDEERRLREEHISFQQQQAKIQRSRQQEILQAMERAKKYVMSKHKEKYRELRMREQHLLQKDRSYKDEIHRAFRRSESQLRKALKRRKAEVKTMYGDLTFADGQYGGSKGRRWKIDWNRAPQPVQIRLKCLRGVKDKLPNSRYVLMVSLYNRLGGNVMKWSSLKGQQWGGATLPMYHDGEFFNTELKIDQSVFTVCPSRPDIRPGMVLVFELFILRGPVTPTDKVVGWGCFPICDAEFNVIEGKYKTPMLRGDLDPGIDKFEVIERLMADDLENWLCNFYFEIIKLPRYMAGQKEYEVELQFTSGLLGAPDRTKTGQDNIDGEKAIFGSRSDVKSSLSHHDDLSQHESLRSESMMSTSNVDENSDRSTEKPNGLMVDMADRSNSTSSIKHKLSHSSHQMFRAENLSQDLRKGKAELTVIKDQMVRPMTSVDASRKLVEEKGLQLSDYGSDSSDYGDDDVYALKKDIGFKPVRREPGMFYKIHYNTPADVYARKVYTMMPKTPILSKPKVKKKLTHMEILNTHSYAVKTPWSNKGHLEHKSSKKVQYIGRMLLSELGISQIKSRTFWAMILMILINFWIRMYCHYIGQWAALYAFLVPISKFQFLPYTVQLNYQNTLLRTREEIALIVIGPFSNIILFVIMVLVSAFIQMLFDRFPNMFSQFIMSFGIHCALDPIWILIVDSALQRYENRGGDYPIGDAFKLYWHFARFYNNDNVALFIGIALTLFLYFVTTFCALTILYMYFLRIHNNGRLMDVYWRLHGNEGDCFVPYDLEISNEELNFICRKAEQWRGEEGERRKTAVYDYIWEEEEMADENWDNPTVSRGKKTGAKETTTHVSIHTLHLDGLRELYRHFLKLPDGAIVEVFGEMNIPGIDEGVKQALMKRTTYQTMTADGVRQRRISGESSASNRKIDNLQTKPSTTVAFLGIPGEESNA